MKSRDIMIRDEKEYQQQRLEGDRNRGMPRLSIRTIQDADLQAILEIEKASFSPAWDGESFRFEVSGKCSIGLVALYREQVIGYLCADYAGHEARILNLAVHPDHRRRGVASLLMEEAQRRLRENGCVFVYLKVRPSNEGARIFYESRGFEIETVRKNYYGDPDEDALQMIARL